MTAAFSRFRRPVRLPGRETWITLLLLLALEALLFRDAVFAARGLYLRDLGLLWYPLVEAFVRIVGAGSWPLWDPFRGFGQPLIADPRAELFYPPTWLNLVVPPWTYQTWFVVGHLVFAGAGVYLLARRWNVSVAGARTATLVWVGSGPLLSLGSLFHHLAGASFLPWLFLAAEVAAVGRGPACVVPLALALAGQVFAGSPDYTAVAGIAIAIGFLVEHVDWGRPLGATVARLARVVAGLALGLALSAAQWLPTLEVARHSERWGFSGQGAGMWSLHPLALLEIALPFRWAELANSPLAAEVLEGREPYLHSIYLGLPALALALAALARPLRRRAVFLAALAAGALLVALGGHAPAYALVTFLVPPLAMLRYPVKLLVLVSLAIALLAGMGFDALRSRPARPAGASWGTWLAVGLACLALADLTWRHRDLNPTAPVELFTHRPAAAAFLPHDPDVRIYVYDYSIRFPPGSPDRPGPGVYRPVRVPLGWSGREALTLGLYDYLNPPTAERWGIRGSFDVDILDFNPAPLSRLIRGLREAEGTPAHTRLLQLGGVTHVLALHEAAWQRELASVAVTNSVFQAPIRVFQVPDPLPRAYVVGGARIADAGAAFDLLRDPGFDPRREIVLPSGVPAPAGSAGLVTKLSTLPDRIDVETRLEAPGYLVVLEAFDAGWTASVDGRAAEVLRANMAFRAVALPAGSHTVCFRYRPRGLLLGLAISAIAALVAGMAWLVPR